MPVQPDQDPVAQILQAIRAERELLRAHEDDLASIVANRLAADGLPWPEIDARFRLGAQPLLRREASHPILPDPLSNVRGHRLVACAARWDEIVAGTEDGRLCAWRHPMSPLGEPDAVVPAHDGRVAFLSFAAGHDLLISGGEDGVVHVWDAILDNFASPRRTCDERGAPITAVLFVPGRDYLVTGSEDGMIRVWQPGMNDPVVRLAGHGAAVTALDLARDGDVLVSASRDGTLRLWELESGRSLGTGRAHTAPVIGCAVVEGVSEPEPRILTAAEDGRLMLWGIDGSPLATLGAHHGAIRDLQYMWSPAAPYAVTAGDDGTVRVWDPIARREERTVRVSGGPVLAAHPHGSAPRRAFSGGADGTCRLLDLDSGRTLRHFKLPGGDARLSVSPAGNLAACVTADGTLTRVDLTAPSAGGRLAVALDRSGQFLLAAAGPQVSGGLWRSGELEWSTAIEGGEIVAAAMERDGDAFVTAHTDGWIRRWTVHGDRTDLTTLDGEPAVLAVGRDVRGLFAAARDGRILEWSGGSGERIASQVPGQVKACVLTEDTLLLACSDGTLLLWDVENDRERTRFGASIGPPIACDLSAGGRLVLAGSAKGALALLDDTGTVLHRLDGHDDAVTGCRFTVDQDRAVSCSRDRTVKWWDLASGRLLATYYADAPLVALATAALAGVIAVVDGMGRVVILRSPDEGATPPPRMDLP